MTKRKSDFDLQAWKADIDKHLAGARHLGTRTKDPLVYWSQASTGPLRLCAVCKGAYTVLGLPRHVKVHEK